MTLSPSRRTTISTLLPVAAAALAVVAGAVPASATYYGGHEVHGAIEQEYLAVAGPDGFLRLPTTDETPTPDGVGRFNHFQGDPGGAGSIYWSPSTGAHEVHGLIRATWQATGWELGPLGYPTTDERLTPRVVGRFNEFVGGSVYWSPTTGAHEVYGAILGRYAQLGWEQSALGFPTSGEYAVPGGRRNDFQGGDITWTPAGGAVVNGATPPPPPAGAPLPPVDASYRDCAALRAASPAYAHGIGRPGAVDSTSGRRVTTFLVDDARYRAQSQHDADGDGIACEQL